MLSVEVSYSAKTPDFQLENFKFYLGDFCFMNNDEVVSSNKSAYYLIELDSAQVLFEIPAPETDFNALCFRLGIDSVMNISGAFPGDLDPTNGMYWTWQSGFINTKIEGSIDHVPFEFHLGGYAFPFRSDQLIHRAISNEQKLVLTINLDEFADELRKTEIRRIMSPRKEAVQLMRALSNCFLLDEF